MKRTSQIVLLVIAVGVLLLARGRRNPAPSSEPTGDSLASHAGLPSSSSERAQSVLVVTCDTTRADRLQPYGATNVDTPAFVRLAAEGIVYEHAYAVAPLTLVSHTSIMTGLWPPSHGVRSNGIHYAAESLLTLAERLHAQGLKTAAFISAAVLDRQYGLNQGFDVYDDNLSAGKDRHPRLIADRSGRVTVGAALSWLDKLAPGDHFFLWVHLFDPHAAYTPPPPYRDDYRERLYDGEIAFLDHEVGRLLSHPRLARERDVLISVLADHGESLGEHGEQTHGLLAYDSTLRIPWLIRVPGQAGGQRMQPAVSQVDLVPTVLEAMGLAPDPGLPGRSILPPFGAVQEDWDRTLYAESYLPFYTYGWAKLRTIRRGPWKYIDAPRPELYGQKRDPYELSNEVERQPGLAHDLARELQLFTEKLEGAEKESPLDIDDELAEKLAKLGYVSGRAANTGNQPRLDPKDGIPLHSKLEAAREMLIDRKFDEAAKALESALEQNPSNVSARADLAVALEGEGRTDEAVTTLQRALELDPTSAPLRLQLAALEDRRGRHEEALALVQEVLQLTDRSIEAHVMLAIELEQLGRGAEAEQTLENALQRWPEHARVNAVAAQILELRQGQVDKAIARARAAVTRDPELILGWRVLGQAYEAAGNRREAEEAYRKGLEARPDETDLHARLGMLLARNGVAEGELHLREAIRTAREFQPEVHVALAAWLADNGRLAEALELDETVLAKNPVDLPARNNRAIALYRSGRQTEAEADLRALVAEHPDQADAYSNLAAMAVDQERWKDAEAAARKALALDAKLFEAWNNLGVALDEQGHSTEAEQALRKALELEPSYAVAQENLSLTLKRRLGNNAE